MPSAVVFSPRWVSRWKADDACGWFLPPRHAYHTEVRDAIQGAFYVPFLGVRERKKSHSSLKEGVVDKIWLGFSCDLMVPLVIS